MLRGVLRGNYRAILGDSPALKKVLAQVEMVAPTNAGVLILGETSCLPVWAASCRPKHGARTPHKPAGWKLAPYFQNTVSAGTIQQGLWAAFAQAAIISGGVIGCAQDSRRSVF